MESWQGAATPLRYSPVRRVSWCKVAFSLKLSFRLQNLAANLPAGICGRVEIEIPIIIHQVLSLFWCQDRLPINGICDRPSRYRNLWLRISSRHRRSVKVCCDDRTSQPSELNVVFELVGFSIQRGGHSSGASAILRRNFVQVQFRSLLSAAWCTRF